VKEINAKKRDIADYKEFIDSKENENLGKLSENLKGKRIAFVNSTAFGGGVAELFQSIVPVSRSMGVDMHWFVMEGDEKFFSITKKMHNMLQGKTGIISKEELDYYVAINRKNAERFKDKFDVVIIHDPQPMAIPSFLKNVSNHFVWRCHIDTTIPDTQIREIMQRFLPDYENTIFSMNAFAEGLGVKKNEVIYPSIDPLSEKNRPISYKESLEIVQRFGVNIHKPMIVQISRFDPWKDPIGVIDIYKKLKSHYKGLQLVLIGSMASDDPEGWRFYQRTLRHAGEDSNLYILSNLDGVGSREVNAFQRIATVVLQKSLREGFGLTVSEALWKKRAVIGGRTGGITVQIQDGENGYLVSSNEECIKDIEELLLNADKRQVFGRRGFKTVKEKFLITRHIKDYLRLFNKILQ